MCIKCFKLDLTHLVYIFIRCLFYTLLAFLRMVLIRLIISVEKLGCIRALYVPALIKTKMT